MSVSRLVLIDHCKLMHNTYNMVHMRLELSQTALNGFLKASFRACLRLLLGVCLGFLKACLRRFKGLFKAFFC